MLFPNFVLFVCFVVKSDERTSTSCVEKKRLSFETLHYYTVGRRDKTFSRHRAGHPAGVRSKEASARNGEFFYDDCPVDRSRAPGGGAARRGDTPGDWRSGAGAQRPC